MSGGDAPISRQRIWRTILGAAGGLAAAAIALLAWRALRAVPDPVPVPSPYAGLRRPAAHADVGAGHRLFVDNCAPCHDESGTGHGPGSTGLSPPPAPLSLHGFLAARSDAYLYWRISEGKPGTAMPSFKHSLSVDERWTLIGFLRSSLEE